MKRPFLSLLLVALLAPGLKAQELEPAQAPAGPPDKTKLSYALGMHTAMQIKAAGAEVSVESFSQALRDVLEGKPTQYSPSEISGLLNRRRADLVEKPDETDAGKASYLQGMRLGLQLKSDGADVDAGVITQAMKDVLDNKPTKLQESEIPPLFRQAMAYNAARASARNKAEGEAFLAKNAKQPGVIVLPDGLQYRVIKKGEGEVPKETDLILIHFKGTLLDGTEFDHHNNFPTRISGGIKSWREALHLMRVGSKFQLFVPPELAFGHEGERMHRVGPDATVIYELELASIVPKGAHVAGTGRVGHGLGSGEQASGTTNAAASSSVSTNSKSAVSAAPKGQ